MNWHEELHEKIRIRLKPFRNALRSLQEQDEEWMREQSASEIKKGDDKAALHIATGKLNLNKGQNDE